MPPESEESERPIGHREQFANDVPELWSTMSRMHPAAWGLPSTTITTFSMFTFVVLLPFLTLPPSSHRTFRLPEEGMLGFLGAAALSTLVWLVGSRRPGPLLPRLWAFGLASFAAISAIAAPQGLFGQGMLPAALSVATLSAALVLSARLLRLSPRSRLLRRVAPGTAFGVFLFIVPISLWIERWYQTADEQEVAKLIEDLGQLRHRVNDVAKFQADRLSNTLDDPEVESLAAENQRLAGLEPPLSERIMRARVVTKGLDEQRGGASHVSAELAEAYVGVLDAARAEAQRPNGGQTSAAIFGLAPIVHVPGQQDWQLNVATEPFPARTQAYSAALDATLEILSLTEDFDGRNGRIERETIISDATNNTFANRWAHHETGARDLLESPLGAAPSPGAAVVLADLGGLFSLRRSSARQLHSADTGCRWVTGQETRDGVPVEWLECFGYAPDLDGARLTIVYRLIYSSEEASELYLLYRPMSKDLDDEADALGKAWVAAAANYGMMGGYLSGAESVAARYQRGFRLEGSPAFVACRIESRMNTRMRRGTDISSGVVFDIYPAPHDCR